MPVRTPPGHPPRWVIQTVAGAEHRPCFVIAGGPSVRSSDVDRLRGRDVMVINSSYTVAPWADYLFFGDDRWWTVHARMVEKVYRGLVVTVARHSCGAQLHLVGRSNPPGFSKDPHHVTMRRTSLLGGMNALSLMGYRTILVMGADGGPVAGKTHHHENHIWPMRKDWVEEQEAELRASTPAIREAGVRVVNLSPVSRYDFWERGNIEDYLDASQPSTEASDDDQRSRHQEGRDAGGPGRLIEDGGAGEQLSS